MIHLRSLVYLAGQVVSAAVIFLAVLLCWPAVGRAGRERIIRQWARFNIWTLDKVCGISHRVIGAANIPAGPAVIIANHQSAWETLVFQLIFPAQSYLLKRELLWIPVFGWGLAMNRPVAINRARKARALDILVKEGAARLHEGRWLVVFPEGARMPPGKPGKFQAGGAMIAVRSQCPVVPVAHNAGVFWPKRSFLKHPGVIDIRIGKPLASTGVKTRQLNEALASWIGAELARLPGTAPR